MAKAVFHGKTDLAIKENTSMGANTESALSSFHPKNTMKVTGCTVANRVKELYTILMGKLYKVVSGRRECSSRKTNDSP